MIVVEIEAAIDAAGTIKRFLFAQEGWTTGPSDDPQNEWVQPRLLQAANMRRDLFNGARVFGEVRAALGECKLANLDGGLDEFARYGVDGRAYTVRFGKPGAAYPDDFVTVLRCTMKCALFELTETSGAVRILLSDGLVDLDRPLAAAVYAATGGAEGTAISAKGVRKPLAFGTSYGCAPQLIDELNLIYAVGAPPPGLGTMALRVQDGGENLIPHPGPMVECANYADLVALSVPSGSYGRCSAEGLIKLGLKPTFMLTCSATVTDLATHTDTSPSLPGNILRHMAVQAGVDPARINAGDVAIVNAARLPAYGYRISDDESARSAMSKIAGSASLWFGFDTLGDFRMGVVAPPAGAPVWEFNPSNVTKIQRLDAEATSIPIWKVTCRTSFNGAPQTTFAGSVPAWWAKWYDSEWPLEVPATNEAVRALHPLAGELQVDVYSGKSGSREDDVGEAARKLALFGVERDMVMVTAPLTEELMLAVDIGKVAMLKYPRFDWGEGVLMLVVSIGIDLDRMRADVVLWG
jgi:hypothetical protein